MTARLESRFAHQATTSVKDAARLAATRSFEGTSRQVATPVLVVEMSTAWTVVCPKPKNGGVLTMRGSAGKLCAVAFALLALSGCALEGEGSSAGGGAIEVAVVQTCEAGSSSDCVVIEGEHVLVTDESFETVDVEDVAAADGEAGSSVTLGLGERGVAVLGAARPMQSKPAKTRASSLGSATTWCPP